MGLTACGDFTPPPEPPDICANLSADYYGSYSAKCTPGETKLAWCNATDNRLSGTRTCGDDGTFWSRATCPSGTPLYQGAGLLIVTRSSLISHPDFSRLAGAIAANGDLQYETVSVEGLMQAFPAPSVQESMRLGIQHLFSREFIGLRYVVFIGKPVPEHRNQFIGALTTASEVPLWYDRTPPSTDHMDYALEEFYPTLKPFMVLRQAWEDDDGPYWTPAVTFDVQAGYLPLDGSPATCSDASCPSDFAAYAVKLDDWRQNRAGKPFAESQFDGFRCAGQPWVWPSETSKLNGTTQTIAYHACENGESGNAWDIATSDGSKFYSYFWHGGATGSSLYSATADTGYAMADVNARFPGPVFALSCSTGAPDEMSWSLGGRLLATVGGPIAYSGYSRVLILSAVSLPTTWAVVKGRQTLGDVMYGYERDQLRRLTSRINARASGSFFLFGVPNITVVPPASKSVRALASRSNDDGTTDVCVEAQAPDGTKSELVVGGRKVKSLEFATGSQQLPVRMTAEESASGALIYLTDCDPTVESCRAASASALRDLPMQCSPLTARSDGTFDIDITTPIGQQGGEGSLALRVTAVTLTCEGGIRTGCFADNDGNARGQTVIETIPVEKMTAGTNRFNLSFQGVVFPKGAQFRALSLALIGQAGSEIGECLVPMNEWDVIDYGLM